MVDMRETMRRFIENYDTIVAMTGQFIFAQGDEEPHDDAFAGDEGEW